MASTLILGGDKLALTMAKLLASVGEKVCLVGGSQAGQKTLEKLLREEVEKDVPFMFPDDLRHQEKTFQERLDRIRFCRRVSEVDSNIRAVLATQKNSLDLLPPYHNNLTPIATLAADALTSNQISVRLFQPIEQTRCAQSPEGHGKVVTLPDLLLILMQSASVMDAREITRRLRKQDAQMNEHGQLIRQVLVSKQTDPVALESIRSLLKTIGIDEITREQADTADRMLHASGNISLDDVIRAILPSRVPADLTTNVMH